MDEADLDAVPSTGWSFHQSGSVVVEGIDPASVSGLLTPQPPFGVAGSSFKFPKSPVVVLQKNFICPTDDAEPQVFGSGSLKLRSVYPSRSVSHEVFFVESTDHASQ